jgi:hypothetical protein
MDRHKMTKTERFYWELRSILPILSILAAFVTATIIIPNLLNPFS